MGQGNSAPRVSGGVPWWLWGVALLATAAVLLGVLSGFDEENIDDVFAEAIFAAESRKKDDLEQLLIVLRKRGLDEDRLGILEGLLSAATTRHPRAVQQLEPYLDHENEELQILAVKFSGISQQAMGNAAAARELFKKSVDLAPDDIQPRTMLLGLYAVAGSLDLVEQQAREILEIDPEDVFAQEQMIFALGESGRLDEALAACVPLLDSDAAVATASPELLEHYVVWLAETDRDEELKPFVEKYRKLIANYDIRFRAILRCGMLDVVDEFLEGQQIPVENPLAVWAKALREMEAENWQNAVRLLGQVAEAIGRSPLVFEHLERAATNNNQPELAEACRQNIEALAEIRRKRYEAVNAIGDDMADPELRLAVARQNQELSVRDEYDRWLKRAVAVASQKQLRDIQLNYSFQYLSSPLIPIPGAHDGSVGNSDSDDDAAPDSKADGEDKPATAEPAEESGEPAEETEDVPSEEEPSEEEPAADADADKPATEEAAADETDSNEQSSDSSETDTAEESAADETADEDSQPADQEGDSETPAE